MPVAAPTGELLDTSGDESSRGTQCGRPAQYNLWRLEKCHAQCFWIFGFQAVFHELIKAASSSRRFAVRSADTVIRPEIGTPPSASNALAPALNICQGHIVCKTLDRQCRFMMAGPIAFTLAAAIHQQLADAMHSNRDDRNRRIHQARISVRFRGQSGHDFLRRICRLLTQSGHFLNPEQWVFAVGIGTINPLVC